MPARSSGTRHESRLRIPCGGHASDDVCRQIVHACRITTPGGGRQAGTAVLHRVAGRFIRSVPVVFAGTGASDRDAPRRFVLLERSGSGGCAKPPACPDAGTRLGGSGDRARTGCRCLASPRQSRIRPGWHGKPIQQTLTKQTVFFASARMQACGKDLQDAAWGRGWCGRNGRLLGGPTTHKVCFSPDIGSHQVPPQAFSDKSKRRSGKTPKCEGCGCWRTGFSCKTNPSRHQRQVTAS